MVLKANARSAHAELQAERCRAEAGSVLGAHRDAVAAVAQAVGADPRRAVQLDLPQPLDAGGVLGLLASLAEAIEADGHGGGAAEAEAELRRGRAAAARVVADLALGELGEAHAPRGGRVRARRGAGTSAGRSGGSVLERARVR